MDINLLWNSIISQDEAALREYFDKDAVIRWHCTNEEFSADEYITVNCKYPGNWKGEIERMEEVGDTVILVGKVFPQEENMSFHVVSFIKIKNDLIVEMDEYWADDGTAPEWRKMLKIGKPVV